MQKLIWGAVLLLLLCVSHAIAQETTPETTTPQMSPSTAIDDASEEFVVQTPMATLSGTTTIQSDSATETPASTDESSGLASISPTSLPSRVGSGDSPSLDSSILFFGGIGIAIIILLVILIAMLIRQEHNRKLPKQRGMKGNESVEPVSGSQKSSLEVQPTQNTHLEETREHDPTAIDVVTVNTGELSSVVIASSRRDTHLGSYRAVCLTPYTHVVKREDRVYAGILAEKHPVLVIADGATTFVSDGGREVPNGGGKAAELACQFTVDQLGKLLGTARTFERMLDGIDIIFGRTDEALKAHNTKSVIPGATTLILALLYEVPSKQRELFWIYGYLGNGDIILLSPTRQIEGWLSESRLLNPHSNGNVTVTLPRTHGNRLFDPIIGVIPYRPGDILVAATDGIDDVKNYLRKAKGVTLANFLWKEHFSLVSSPNTPEIPELSDALKSDPGSPQMRMFDDTTLTAIWTQSE